MTKAEREAVEKAAWCAQRLLSAAGQGAEFTSPEGQALLGHCQGLLNETCAWARQGRRTLADIEAASAEVGECVAAWRDRGELKPAGDPDFESLLRFYREG